MAFDGLLLGIEGVLCSTARFHRQAWETILNRYGLSAACLDALDFASLGRQETLRLILNDIHVELSEAECDTLVNEKNDLYRQLLSNLTPESVLPDTARLLGSLKRAGYRLCVVTTSRNAILLLRRLGIYEMFDGICDGNDLSFAAGLYRKACALMGVPPQKAAVWENIAAKQSAARAEGFIVMSGSARDIAARLF